MEILLVMISETSARVVDLLDAGGHGLRSATDLPNGLAIARRERWDLVVVGDRLPGGGGPILVRRLRSMAGTAHIPIVGVASDAAALQSLRDAGVNRCLLHSHLCDELVDVVEGLGGSVREVVPTEAPAEALRAHSRLDALARTSLVAGQADPAFDDLAWVASRLLPASTCLVSMVGGEDQFFPGRVDHKPLRPGPRRTGLDESFCQWAVSAGEPLVVEDSRAHPLLRHNRAVAVQGVGAYAGIPLQVEGETLGTLCALDYGPRRWDDDDLAYLNLLARVAEAELGHRVGSGSTSPVRSGLSALLELENRAAAEDGLDLGDTLGRIRSRLEDRLG